MKRVATPVEVRLQREVPVRLRLGRRVIRVDGVMGTWLVEGRWWSGEVCRRYYRLLTSTGVVELYHSGETWMLSKILD